MNLSWLTSTGINSFNGKADLSDVKVTGSGGGGEYITSDLKTTLQNPSNVSLSTVDIALPVIYKNTKIGRAAINVSAFDFFYYLSCSLRN
jgi:hypothetical protein